ELILYACVGAMLAVIQEVHIPFQELIVRVRLGVHQLNYAKRGASDGEDVHATVVVALDDLGHFRGATDTDNSLRQTQQHSELRLFLDAAAHHFPVSWLEYMQGKSCAGKENDVQREKRNSFRPRECHS